MKTKRPKKLAFQRTTEETIEDLEAALPKAEARAASMPNPRIRRSIEEGIANTRRLLDHLRKRLKANATA